MSKFHKVRGKGKKDREIEELHRRIAELEAERAGQKPNEDAAAEKADASQTEAGQTSDGMPKAKKRPRKYTRHDVRKLAYDYYEFMGGKALDVQIANESAKARAFASQMRVAEGRDYFGQGSWGPDITPYENRMGGSLLSRLIAQKDKLMDKYAAMMEESLKEQEELEEEGHEPPKVDFTNLARPSNVQEKPGPQARPEDASLRYTFTEEEKQTYLDNFMRGNPYPPKIVVEVEAAMQACHRDPRRITPDIYDLFMRAGKLHDDLERAKTARAASAGAGGQKEKPVPDPARQGASEVSVTGTSDVA